MRYLDAENLRSGAAFFVDRQGAKPRDLWAFTVLPQLVCQVMDILDSIRHGSRATGLTHHSGSRASETAPPSPKRAGQVELLWQLNNEYLEAKPNIFKQRWHRQPDHLAEKPIMAFTEGDLRSTPDRANAM